jgi:hypothetical protein
MGLDILFVGFLQRIAVGAGAVFALILFIRLGMPRRSAIINRGTTDKLSQP